MRKRNLTKEEFKIWFKEQAIIDKNNCWNWKHKKQYNMSERGILHVLNGTRWTDIHKEFYNDS